MAVKFCSNCGKPLLKEDKFCSVCGKSTARTETEVPTAPTTRVEKKRKIEEDDLIIWLFLIVIAAIFFTWGVSTGVFRWPGT